MKTRRCGRMVMYMSKRMLSDSQTEFVIGFIIACVITSFVLAFLGAFD